MPTPSVYLHEELAPEDRPGLGDKWVFVGIDLAPNDMLETGVVAVDRDKQMLRMDKVNTDGQVHQFVESLGPLRSTVVALDVPKSLSIPGRWRQEEVKMFPLRLERAATGEFTDRCSERAWNLYQSLRSKDCLVFLYFNHLAKTRYDLFIPFRTRTPRGCRALQAVIKNQLDLGNMPGNLAPSSVLDAMVGAYTAWTLYRGNYGEDYRLHWDINRRLMLEPLRRVDG